MRAAPSGGPRASSTCLSASFHAPRLVTSSATGTQASPIARASSWISGAPRGSSDRGDLGAAFNEVTNNSRFEGAPGAGDDDNVGHPGTIPAERPAVTAPTPSTSSRQQVCCAASRPPRSGVPLMRKMSFVPAVGFAALVAGACAASPPGGDGGHVAPSKPQPAATSTAAPAPPAPQQTPPKPTLCLAAWTGPYGGLPPFAKVKKVELFERASCRHGRESPCIQGHHRRAGRRDLRKHDRRARGLRPHARQRQHPLHGSGRAR